MHGSASQSHGSSRARGAFVVLVVIALGIVATAAIYFVRRQRVDARRDEARSSAMLIAQGVARCATPRGSLPPSSPAVPADRALVSGHPYTSKPEDWVDHAFRCASFSPERPQWFRYQFLRLNDAAGIVRAEADFDGDGAVDTWIEVDVVCGASGCRAATETREQ